MPENNNQINTYFCLKNDLNSIEQFLNLAIHKQYKKGESIFPIGEPVVYLYYVKRGRVGRLVTAANGAEKYIKVVCDQGIIGEVLFFLNQLNYTPFIAIENCDCYLFDRHIVNQVLLKNEQFVQELIHWFCQRMTALNEQVTDSLIKSPYHRICKFLLDYVEEFGTIDKDGHSVFQGKLSHYDIAKFLGINRVSVTNVLKQLQDEGIILKERKLLVLLDKDYLIDL